MIKTFEFKIATQGQGDAMDVTGKLEESIENAGLINGIVAMFVPGSTGALTTIEFEPGAVKDLNDAISRIVPQEIPYAHNARWGDGNGHSHVRAALMGPSLTVPVAEGRAMLGTWQQVILIDFDNRPRDRRLICQVMGDGAKE